MLEWIYWLIRDALFFFGMVSGGFPKPLTRKERMVIEMRYGMLDGKAPRSTRWPPPGASAVRTFPALKNGPWKRCGAV